MNYRQMALQEAYHVLYTHMLEDTQGRLYKDNGRPFTEKELLEFREAWIKEIRRIEKRLAAAGIDFVPAP